MNQFKTNILIRILPFVLFFLAGLFYLYWFTGYIFFYQEKSSLFIVSFSYLAEHLRQPGGFLTYLGNLQTTFYYNPLAGAVLVTLEICAIVYLVGKIAEVLNGRRCYFISFVIGAALFYLQTNYQYSAFNNVGILIQLLLFYRAITWLKKEYEWIAVVLFPGIYFLFGSFSAIFLFMFSAYLFLNRGWLKLAIVWITGFLFFFVGKEFLFFQTTQSLIQFPLSIQDIGLQTKLFGTTISVIVLLPFLFKLNLSRFSIKIKNIQLLSELTPFVVLIVLAFLVVPRIDKKNSHYFHVEKLFYQQKYDEIIRFNAQFPSTNMLTGFLNNVALAENGRLTERFFSFPQSKDGGSLFLKWEIITEVLKRGGYYYYSLGMINEAQRWAYEYMVMKGNTPEVLIMLIKTDLIKGKYKTAEKYISILEKSVFYRKDARELRKLLYNDAAVSSDIELGIKQKLDTKQDFFVTADNPAANLDLIIEADSTNIMAIEYKLAWLMLQKDMKGIVEMLPIMEKAGYTRIPKNVEEAVVSYKLLKVGEMPELHKLRINPQTEQKFQQYYRIFQQNRNNRQQAQIALSKEFADTFWYYVFFR